MNKNDILKNFALGFIPLFVFIIADELFGTETGLIVAVAVGVVQLVYYIIRYRRLEKFIFFDTGLIILLGSISILLHDEIFFKLKPGLIELILVALVGVHAFSSKPVLLLMGKRYLGDMKILPEQEEMMRRLSKVLFFIFLIHTILIVYSAYFWSKEVWAFISGGLFYILFGIILAGQWVYIKFFKNKTPAYQASSGEEWFDLVNEHGKVTGKAPRSAVHGNPKLLHPTVHLHIFNKNGKLYLQKRSKNKDLYPGYWDTAVGGHVSSGEAIEAALIRESLEELGIKPDKAQPLFRYVMSNEWESELIHSFKMVHNGPFKINREEIEIGRFWTIFEIKKMIGQDIFTPNFEQEFALLEKIKVV